MKSTGEPTRPCARCGKELLFAQARIFYGEGGTYRLCKRVDQCAQRRAKLPRCAACGEVLLEDLAETSRGVIHAECLAPGEALA